MKPINPKHVPQNVLKMPEPVICKSPEYWRGVKAALEILKYTDFDKQEAMNMLNAAKRALGEDE